MKLGAGVRVREVRGNHYLIFWHYEDGPDGRRVKREDYIGKATPENRAIAWRALLDYSLKVHEDILQVIHMCQSEIDRNRFGFIPLTP